MIYRLCVACALVFGSTHVSAQTPQSAYIKNFSFKTAETRHLIGILNQITKKDWQPWFDRYVFGTETPVVN